MRRAGGAVELRVTDTGTGIPAKEMPKLFERFHRVENARGRTHEGSGIGLALVQELVKLHGGSISAQSEAGRGTTFLVSIPLGADHLPPDRVRTDGPARATAAGANPFVEEALRWLPHQPNPDPRSDLPPDPEDSLAPVPGGDRPRVLVADDNADMRQYVERLLAGRYRVEAVADGEAALAAVRRQAPGLVVSDVMMPRLDGFGLLRALRADPATVGVPVILLSARAGEESRVEGMRAGADDYLVKPFSARELLVRAAALLQVTRLRREADQAVRASEERLRALVTATSDVVYRTSGDWTEMRHLRGRGFIADTHEPSRAWLQRYIPPADQPRVMAAIAAAVRAKGVFELEHRVVRVDGTTGWTFSRAVPLLDADGEIVEWFGTASDVTARKVAEEEVRFQAHLLDAVGQAAIATDPEGRIIYWNRFAEALYGWSREEVLHRNVLGVTPAPEVMEQASEVMGRLRSGETCSREFLVRRRDGTTFPVFVTDTPILDDRGRVKAIIGISTDISERKRLEKGLRESEGRFRGLMEQAPFSIQVFDPDGRTLRVNRAWEELWGVTLEQIADYNVLHDPQLERKGIAPYLRRAFAGEPVEVPAIEYDPDETIPDRTRHPDPLRWVSAVAYPLKDDAGRVREVILVHRDITARKRAEDALRESEARFRQLADAMPQIVWTAGPDGDIDYLNRRWTEFTGLPQTAGTAGWANLLHPDDAGPAAEQWERSRQTGEPFEMGVRLFDRDARAYRWHLIRTVAVRDEAGRVARWFGTATDIHGQKRAEESSRYLAEASAALAGVVDYESTLQKVANLAVPRFADWAAVDVADEGGAVRRLAVAHRDPAKVALAHELMRDYPPDPRSPTGVLAVLRTGQPELVGEITDEMLARGARDDRHLGLIRSLGLKSYIGVPLVASGTPLGVLTFATAESGRLYAAADLALAADLARRAAVAVENTRLYQALKEADRRKDEFLATLAHELRNPLAPIRTGLQILRMSDGQGRAAEQARAMMERQLGQMVHLVDDLLDLSRISRGKIELRKERVDLARVVQHAVETIRPAVERAGHDLSVALPPGPVPVDADPTRLAQVFSNLLHNAVKYTDPGGRVELAVRRAAGEAVVSVRDSGIGIPADMLPRVFDMFTQVDRNLARGQGGLGIGLSIVKRLVEMHGGAVAAFSEGPAKGSEFVVRLPIAPSTVPDAGVGGDESPRPAVPRRILVVDDNQDAATSLALMLGLMGNQTETAFDGLEALERAPAFRPDVVLLDIGMPRLSGYDTARRIRQEAWGQSLVLVALTGWGQEEDRRKSREAGFDLHLTKPVDPARLEKLLVDLRADQC